MSRRSVWLSCVCVCVCVVPHFAGPARLVRDGFRTWTLGVRLLEGGGRDRAEGCSIPLVGRYVFIHRLDLSAGRAVGGGVLPLEVSAAWELGNAGFDGRWWEVVGC